MDFERVAKFVLPVILGDGVDSTTMIPQQTLSIYSGTESQTIISENEETYLHVQKLTKTQLATILIEWASRNGRESSEIEVYNFHKKELPLSS